jgi:hypothetical protein
MNINTNIKADLILLDSVLTGASIQNCIHTASNQSLEHVYDGQEYYLSDGGYSRLVFNYDSKFFVTSNSLDMVKKNWGTLLAQTIVARLETAINNLTEG